MSIRNALQGRRDAHQKTLTFCKKLFWKNFRWKNFHWKNQNWNARKQPPSMSWSLRTAAGEVSGPYPRFADQRTPPSVADSGAATE